jgi:hypothetical protein
MAERIYRSPVGTDLNGITGIGWQIAGIRIDNPSGSWLLVSGIDQYVPPYRLGWEYPVTPQASSLDVRFTDSPSGSESVNEGDPITVTVYDSSIPPNQGFASGAGMRVTTVPPLSFAQVSGTSTPAGSAGSGFTLTTNPTTARQQLVIRRLSATYEMGDTVGGINPPPSANCQILFECGAIQIWGGLSPEKPFLDIVLEDGTVVGLTGNSLQGYAMNERGSGIQSVFFTAQYYRQRDV